MATSKPSSIGATTLGNASGSCEKSASISMKASYPRSSPQAKPARYALPNPDFSVRASRWASGNSAATALTMSAVPSGLPSSTTSTPAPGRHSVIRCSMRSMFSDSL